MTGALGVENEADDQRIVAAIIGQLICQLVAPQPCGLPGAQIVKHHADHIRPLSRNRNEFEVLQDDTSEWEVSPGHVPPISERARDQCYRSADLCRGTPGGKSSPA